MVILRQSLLFVGSSWAPEEYMYVFLQNVVFIYLQSRAGNSTGEEEEERLYQLRLAAEAEIREAKKANEAKIKELGKEWKFIFQ